MEKVAFVFLIVCYNLFSQNYGISWVGYYNGSCDVYIAATNINYTNKVAISRNLRWTDNEITFDLECRIPVTPENSIGTGSSTGILFTFRGNINSHSSISYIKNTANRRITFTITRNSSTISGQVYSEQLLTGGGYQYLGTATFNVILDPSRKYSFWGYVKTSGGAGSQPIPGVTINGTPNNVITASDGRYVDQVLYGWSGRLTPQKNGYSFSPAFKDHSVPVTSGMEGPFFTGYIVSDVNEPIIDDNIDYYISNNYPNPFNPTTKIRYYISEPRFVTIKIYDVKGKEIAILVNQEKTAGSYEVDFDASGRSSGIYLCQLLLGNIIETKKMTLIK